MKEPLNEMSNLINQVENHLQALSKEYDVEHSSGPQGFTTMYLFRNQDKEIFIKDIERELDISKSVTSNLIKRMEKMALSLLFHLLSIKDVSKLS